VTASNAWPSSIVRWTRGRQTGSSTGCKRVHPTCTERRKKLNLSADGRVATVVGRTWPGGHRVQTEREHTNWRLSLLTFLPSLMMAQPSSPSRVRCAAPYSRRALDRSGRLCKIAPLGRKRWISGRQRQKQSQNQNLLDIHRHSHGRRLHSSTLSMSVTGIITIVASNPTGFRHLVF